MRRRLPGETMADWRRRNEPDLVMLGALVVVALVLLTLFVLGI